MPFIGNKPTAVPLSGDDIQDGTITSSDLQSGVIQNQSAFKNIIINGDMSIAQRGTSATGIGVGYYTCDRWRSVRQIGGFTQSQSTDVPSGQGFARSLKMDCTTADASPASNGQLAIAQRLEGQMLQYIKKGTSNAESLTMSFWVKSNKTGTYTAEIFDDDNTRKITRTYTIDSSNTWEKKTLTFAGDTTGTLDNDNARSFEVSWWLGTGSDKTSGTYTDGVWQANVNANRLPSSQVNLADSTANEWYITGVQLETGTTASDFEFLPYDVNLQRCQRYYHRINPNGTSGSIGSAAYYISTAVFVSLNFPTSMRTSPSMEQVTGTNYYNINRNGANDEFNTFTLNTSNIDSADLYVNADVSGTAGHAGRCRFNSASGYVAFSAEL